MNKILSVNTRCYPCEWEPMNPPATLVVLVEGDMDDYAAYAGHGSPEWVARFGDKICFAEAQVHFPMGLEQSKYRER